MKLLICIYPSVFKKEIVLTKDNISYQENIATITVEDGINLNIKDNKKFFIVCFDNVLKKDGIYKITCSIDKDTFIKNNDFKIKEDVSFLISNCS